MIVRCDSIGGCGSCRRTSRGTRVLKNRGRGLAGVSHEIFLSRPRFLMARWTIRDRAVKDFYLVNFINCTTFHLIPLIFNFLLFSVFVFLPSIFFPIDTPMRSRRNSRRISSYSSILDRLKVRCRSVVSMWMCSIRRLSVHGTEDSVRSSAFTIALVNCYLHRPVRFET